MSLEEIIIQKIRTEGTIPFREFMEMCLYYPELGFYTSQHCSVGPEGAFYTSAYLTPVFGAMIAKQFEELWQNLGCKSFTVIEFGAGTGMLCHDILSYFKNYRPEMYDDLHYVIIEKSKAMIEIERQHLPEKVSWCDSLEEVDNIEGCVFSNELVDNFAVSQVVMRDQLMEVYVTYQDGFQEILLPASEEIKQYFEQLGVQLPYGYRTEVNLHAIDWLYEVSKTLKAGYVLTVNYGYMSDELYKPLRSQGTLLCYRDHKPGESFYQNIGQQDITSHVNFSALSYWGQKNHLKECWCTDQCSFLTKMGFNEFLNESLSKEGNIIQAAKQLPLYAISYYLIWGVSSRSFCSKRYNVPIAI